MKPFKAYISNKPTPEEITAMELAAESAWYEGTEINQEIA